MMCEKLIYKPQEMIQQLVQRLYTPHPREKAEKQIPELWVRSGRTFEITGQD